jgi:arabinogalactan oligomer/maltooligosaccharide transport system substrate-binding protein
MLFVMLATILAACGGGTTDSTTGASGAPATASSAPATDASTAPEASAAASEAAASEAAASEAPAASAGASAEASTAAEAPAAPTEPAPETIGSGSEKVVVWHNWGGGYSDAIKALLTDYATQNNVAVELLQVPDIGTKVNVAVPAGQGPDIIAWVNDQIGKNAELGVIQPLDDKGIDVAYLEQNYVAPAVAGMQYKGQVWGVPESMESIAFLYNKDLVSESDLPKTTDELIQKAQAFNQANPGKYYFVYQAGTAAGDAYHNAPWWYGSGASYVSEDGTVGLDTPESDKAGELLKQFSTLMPKEIDFDVSRSLFTENNAAIWLTGPWAISDVEKAGVNYGVAPIPTISSSGQPGKPFVGVKIMMLAEGAKNVEGAIALMQHYGSQQFQAALAKANKQVPANKAAQEEVKSDPTIGAFIQATANGVPLPNTPFMDALWAPTGEAQAAIWAGTQEPAEALKAAAEVATQNVEQIK